ncbi:MAG: nucleotidyltransferase domain-containing protein [Thaumarchaeota archaeon]|nr:nucleotidyltransferase domain-containing protein [Candidatus Calditenuaceae archaeon]MDW8186662.1 nucleotidyltransferase domain-containing protein [Nitrososphaerota archaeon]
MADWVPSWLGWQYGLLLSRFWTGVFTSSDAAAVGVQSPRVVLSRLVKLGWVERVGRGEYRVVHPLAVLTDVMYGWRSRVVQKAYLPLLEFVLARLWEGFGGRLRTVLLFGSVARGKAVENSDVDLLVVADGMPSRYGDRVRLVLNMVEGWEEVKNSIGRRFGVHPVPEMLLLDTEEVDTSQPFYLDLVHEAVIMYDKGGFMAEKLETLRSRLAAEGVQRIQLMDGKWYWVMPQKMAP